MSIRRTSFQDKVGKKVNYNNQNEKLDYKITMIHETNDIDDDGEPIEYKMGIPYTSDDFKNFVGSILESRKPISERFLNQVQDKLMKGDLEDVRELVLDSTILMGFSIKYKDFEDDLVFRVVATDRLIDGAMTRLTKEVETAFNKCKSEDELRVKWMMIKRVLSGRKVVKQLEPSEYGHGFSIGHEGFGSNHVYGFCYGCMVLVSEMNSDSMNYITSLSDDFEGQLDWSISNFQPANVRAIGNMKFNIVDERETKKNFYGVKYNIVLSPSNNPKYGKSAGKQELDKVYEIMKKRWLVNRLESIEVKLVDLNLEYNNMNDSSDFDKYKKSYHKTRGVTVEDNYRGTRNISRKNESTDDIGIFRSINYSGLFDSNESGIKYIPLNYDKDVQTRERQFGHGKSDGTLIIRASNISELFQIMYLNDKNFKKDVDNYFKEYKTASTQMLVEVLKASKDVNLPLMLLNKYKFEVDDILVETDPGYFLPF